MELLDSRKGLHGFVSYKDFFFFFPETALRKIPLSGVLILCYFVMTSCNNRAMSNFTTAFIASGFDEEQ